MIFCRPTRSRALSGAILGTLFFGLAGCETTGTGAAGGAAAPSQGGAVRVVERKVEAPEIFQATEMGLWDGVPSVGGVWVAYAGDTISEVLIRNDTTGKSVNGALFAREKDLPGPAFQLSSDAATALGMVAGTPSRLTVTALAVKQIEIRDETAPAPEPEAEAGTESEPATPVADGTIEVEPLAEPAAVAADTMAAIKAVPAAAPAATAAVAPAATPVAAPAAAPAARPVSSTAKPSSQPLPAGAVPETGSDLARPFIQVGSFADQANADATVAKLKAKGVPARTSTATSAGKTIYRVVAGPAKTSGEFDSYLAAVKSLGFKDAFPTKG